MKSAVEKKLGSGYRVDEVTVDKLNGVSLEALVIHKENVSLAPTIYLKPYYEDYQSGMGLKEGCEKLLDAFYNAFDPTERPLDDLDAGTRTTGEGKVVQVDDLVGTLGGDADELLHLCIGHVQHLTALAPVVIDDGAHDVAQRLVEVARAAYLRQVVIGGM